MADLTAEKLSELSVEDQPKPEGAEDAPEETKSGLIYDPRMKDHRNEVDPYHPETPERIERIWGALGGRGYTRRCLMLSSRDATEEEIKLAHKDSHFQCMAQLPQMDLGQMVTLSRTYNSVFFNQSTFPCAMLSAGCVVELTTRVVLGKVKNGIAVVRPGGHHAEAGYCMGFCIFNNVAVAAQVAIQKHGVERILIVDWDVHHGNSTQNMFYDNKRVLYFSLHRYDNGLFYPGRKEADYTYTGGKDARGYNVNVAWNNATMGDAEYLAAFHHVLLPIAYEYNPDLVIISCGFDAAEGDPLGRYRITPAGYAHMTHLLMGLAGGRVVLALEGGYNLTSISNSMCACAAALLGDPLPRLESTVPNNHAVTCIVNTAKAHAKYWKSMRIFEASSTSSSERATPETQHTTFGRGEPQMSGHKKMGQIGKPEDVPPSSKSHGQEATPTTQSRDQEGMGQIASDEGLTESQQRIFQSLQDAGNVVMFAVVPKLWCEHLSQVQPLPSPEIDASQICETCGESREPWICLVCYHVFCGRYINQHMVDHGESSGHDVALSLADLSVWCYSCDSYIDNHVLRPAKNALHKSKFGCDLPGGAS